MDLYHRVLHRLCEITGGNGSKAVDFKDLVRKMSFHAHYSEIFEHLSREGWIIETAKADFVSITHWGVEEDKKSAAASGTQGRDALKREVLKTMAAAKELAGFLENFSAELSAEDFPPIEQKFGELQNLFAQTKNKLL